jgi:hypothetical protein
VFLLADDVRAGILRWTEIRLDRKRSCWSIMNCPHPNKQDKTGKDLKSIFGGLLSVALLIALVPTRAWAAGGCVDSPEEPTLALGLLGITVSAVTYFRARFRGK